MATQRKPTKPRSAAKPRKAQSAKPPPAPVGGAHVVDAYLATLPPDVRAALEKVRKIIQAAAPEAVEDVSYGIPAFKHHGMLVGFGAGKDHCAFYVMSPATMQAFQEELKPYDTATATIRFPASKPLPAALIKRLVHARIKENEAIR